ncbi:MAG: homogentisate 1,2-dioxygenase [Acidimicrobiales bacterium]
MTALHYLAGFGNEHETETEPNLLPQRGNSPQQPAKNLFAEQLSGSAFTAPRSTNKRTWLYRVRPSVRHLNQLQPTEYPQFITAPDQNAQVAPQTKWLPDPTPPKATSWLDSISTLATNGSAHLQIGGAIHSYRFSTSDEPPSVFVNADSEMVIVPQLGSLRLNTEMGVIELAPGEFAVIPPGIKFATDTEDDVASGWINENYGQSFTLPDPGVIGLNALAMPRDFLYPVAVAQETETPSTITLKAGGQFFVASLEHSPLDVVAWRGNYAPYKYDTRQFCPIGPTLFDHPDPSLGTVLTSPSEKPGTANIDLVIFPERWLVAEDTFRPPWFHSNTMSEFMGLIEGSYDAKPGHAPGTATLHNQYFPHGPTADVVQRASSVGLQPEKLTDTLAFMLESRYTWNLTEQAATSELRDHDYPTVWDGLGET